MATPRLSDVEVGLCGAIGVDAAAVLATKPKAVIVGESPPPDTDNDAPLFPHPVGSSGANLRELSGLTHQAFMETFLRANLLGMYPDEWPSREAVTMARAFTVATRKNGWPLVLLGKRVAKSFGLEHAPRFEWFCLADVPQIGVPTWVHHAFIGGRRLRAIVLPLPGSLNPVWNDLEVREQARQALADAAYGC